MSGTMRPSDGPTDLIATIFIHSRPHRIDMSSSPSNYANAQWELVPSGNYFWIRSLYHPEPDLAMTVSAVDTPGTLVMAAKWSGHSSQLWTATNEVGKLWTFVSLGGNALQPANFNKGANLVLGQFGGSPGTGQLWVYPND